MMMLSRAKKNHPRRKGHVLTFELSGDRLVILLSSLYPGLSGGTSTRTSSPGRHKRRNPMRMRMKMKTPRRRLRLRRSHLRFHLHHRHRHHRRHHHLHRHVRQQPPQRHNVHQNNLLSPMTASKTWILMKTRRMRPLRSQPLEVVTT